MDEPAIGCLLSQYAGWKLAVGDYFAMASGPMRAMRGKEPVFERLAYREWSEVAVGVLETARLPTEQVIEEICRELNTEPEDLTLLAAPTASIAGSCQIVARSVETCMHKLFELGYDVRKVRAAVGTAFLPPVPKNDLQAIGRTNDSILYGADVHLWVEGDDAALFELGPRLPSAASPDYGVPFVDVFQRYKGDFYAIDPLLFSPALVAFNNVTTGSSVAFGRTDYEVLARSFFEPGK
jgi:methenyltetrahydromethanopterin cyclohydrolase